MIINTIITIFKKEKLFIQKNYFTVYIYIYKIEIVYIAHITVK